MSFVIASQLTLWIGILVLAGVVIALAREVARLRGQIASAGVSPQAVAEVGGAAPRLSLKDNGGRMVEVGAPGPGRSQLIFYMSPDCPTCKSLLPTLKSAASAEADWLDIIMASDGEGPQHGLYVAAHGLQDIPYLVADALGGALGVSKLPHATLIDDAGLVVAKAQVNSRAQLESLLESRPRGVARLQAFSAKRPAVSRAR